MPIDQETMVTSLPGRAMRALPIGSDEIVELRHRRGLAVEDLVLEEDDRVGIADRGLQQALGVGRRVRRHDLQAGHVEYQAA